MNQYKKSLASTNQKAECRSLASEVDSALIYDFLFSLTIKLQGTVLMLECRI